MERIEMVEKIREHANVSVEEARGVLEKNNWDILDAMVELEREGKLSGVAESSTKRTEPEYEDVTPTASGKREEKVRRAQNRQEFREKVRNAFRVLLDNRFVVKNKNGELVFRIPVLVPIICALAAVWLTVIVLVAGIVFGYRYSFEGKEFGKKSVNDGMTKVTEFTQNVVNSITKKDDDGQGEEPENKD